MTTLWAGRRVVVCVGTGGVGKTTVSAALGLAAAAQGLRTLVMTIDPARRLAQALGLHEVSNEPHTLDNALLAQHGVQMRGSLSVLMPDVKRTFDALIKRWAPDASTASQILDNRIYQHFSSALAGSHEYAAVEKLYEVYTSGDYDLIVLDTPPAQHAIDFLEAPGRILDFLDGDALGWLGKPARLAGKLSLRLLDFSAPVLFKTVSKLAGGETLQELLGFLKSLQSMYAGFGERSRHVQALLASPELAFVLVGGPGPLQQEAMRRFTAQLAAAHLGVHGAVLNRVRPLTYTSQAAARLADIVTPLLDNLGASDATKLVGAIRDEAMLSLRDAEAVDQVRQMFAPEPVFVLPELPPGGHALASLARLHTAFV